MGEGYDVYVVADASGGVSVEAHDMAIRRLLASGAQPITWLGMAGELQRDWARTAKLNEVLRSCSTMLGVWISTWLGDATPTGDRGESLGSCGRNFILLFAIANEAIEQQPDPLT